MIALPLIEKGRRFGAIEIYATENDVFDEKEINLLMELANNVSYGITSSRLFAKYKLIERDLETQRRNEKTIRDAREELVQRIQERTDEFQEAKNRFQEEISELALKSEILDIFRLGKLGYNNSIIIKEGLKYAKSIYHSKKFNWKKQFIFLYKNALKVLLDGANIETYARMLNVGLPEISDVKLGNEFSI